MQRVGILGGTFDPVHIGHIQSVVELASVLQLEQVRLLPVGQHALKTSPLASAEQRQAMLKIATAPYPQLYVDDRELRREGTSYSIDTCRELRSEFGESACLCFIVGSDVLPSLQLWRDWRRLPEVVNLVVMERAIEPAATASVALDSGVESLLADTVTVIDRPHGQVARTALSGYAVSSTRLREQLCARNVRILPGEGASPQSTSKEKTSLWTRIKRCCQPAEDPGPGNSSDNDDWQQLLPPGVMQYITRHNLYMTCRGEN